jgi:hypothetical protein
MMLRPPHGRTVAETEAFKLTLKSPVCEVDGCLGLNDEVPGGQEHINCLTYQTETGTRVAWFCDSHVAPFLVDDNGNPNPAVNVRNGGTWEPKT